VRDSDWDADGRRAEGAGIGKKRRAGPPLARCTRGGYAQGGHEHSTAPRGADECSCSKQRRTGGAGRDEQEPRGSERRRIDLGVIRADVHERDQHPDHQGLAPLREQTPPPRKCEPGDQKRAADPACRYERIAETSGLPAVPEQPQMEDDEGERRKDEKSGNGARDEAGQFGRPQASGLRANPRSRTLRHRGQHSVKLTPELFRPQVIDCVGVKADRIGRETAGAPPDRARWPGPGKLLR
jgi:hypothetical protein